MKKIFLLFFTPIILLFSTTKAQISAGGKPLTMRLFGVANLDSALNANPFTSSINDLSKTKLSAIKVSKIELPSPDLTHIMAEDRIKDKKNDMYREAVTIASDISLENSGKWTILESGEKIWRLKISLPGAKAIGLYYDHFYLPDGAKYFIFNENGHQILGAYTSDNNPDDDIWANEKVQGEVINLELDLPANVDTSAAHLHINSVADFYRSTEYLNRYTGGDKLESTLFPYGGSSPCEINAICPLGTLGATYADQRKATVKIEYEFFGGIYGITGVLMNTTQQNCTPYILTASHGDPTNSMSNIRFASWIFYFNYETPTCNYKGVDSDEFSSQTITGATFAARSSYDSSDKALVGDFLLLKLKKPVPVNYNAYYAGWDITGNTPIGNFISYHHPSGDVKKVAVTTAVSPDGNFNGGDGQNDTHWALTWTDGGTEEGSSGSGLFEPNGRLIGDLSGGKSVDPSCTYTNSAGDSISTTALYSKISLNWDYVYEKPSTPQTRLHDWLDPNNTGATTLDATQNTTGCIASGISKPYSEISVNVYPNPTKGILFADINLDKVSNLTIEIYNMIGVKVFEKYAPGVLSGKYSLNISNEPSGTYLVRISTDYSSITEKVISFNK